MHSRDAIAFRDDLLHALLANDRKLISVAYGVLKSRQSAEDVFQDAIVKVCVMRPPCLRCPLSYAYRMVYNLALDEARRRRFEASNLLPIDEASSITDGESDALDQVCQASALAQMCNAIESLPQRTRTAFIRHYIHGIPQKDIASEFGVSRTLVNFLIKDALTRCRACLADTIPSDATDRERQIADRRGVERRARQATAKESKPSARHDRQPPSAGRRT